MALKLINRPLLAACSLSLDNRMDRKQKSERLMFTVHTTQANPEMAVLGESAFRGGERSQVSSSFDGPLWAEIH